MSKFWQTVKANLKNVSDTRLKLLEKCGFDSLIAFQGVLDYEELVNEIEQVVSQMSADEAGDLHINNHNKPLREFKFLFGEKCEMIQIVKMIKDVPIAAFDDNHSIDGLLARVKSSVEKNPNYIDLLTWISSGKENEILLRELLSSSIKNERSQKNNRYTKELILISAYLYLKIGRASYEFLYNNLTLPSVSSVRTRLYEIYPKIKIGKVYARELKNFLMERTLPMLVGFAEDATRVKAEIKYDENLKQILGVLIPCDRVTGLPNCDTLFAETPEDIINIAKGRPKVMKGIFSFN
jgi:hypothetical protein